MKQSIEKYLLGVLCLLCLQACTEVGWVDGADETALSFTFGLNPNEANWSPIGTKGSPVTQISQVANMGVFAYYTGESTWNDTPLIEHTIFHNQLITNATPTWSYSPLRYWPQRGNISFFSYAPYGTGSYDATNNPLGNGIHIAAGYTQTPTITYTVPSKCENQPDLMIGTEQLNKSDKKGIDFKLKHALACIGFKVQGDQEKIGKIALKGVRMSGELLLQTATDGSVVWSNLSEATEAVFEAGIPKDLIAGNESTSATNADGYLMMIPQKLQEGSTLIIEVNGVEKELALTGSWEAGKQYIYSIKFSYPVIEINGVKWATGNLVADGPYGCKVGAPNDCGLYFQFGSLIGWRGGANGDGTGTPTAYGGSEIEVVVKPISVSGVVTWSDNTNHNISQLDNHFFNYNTTPWGGWEVPYLHIDTFRVDVPGAQGQGSLQSGKYAHLGVGDPCSHYLGGGWRLPSHEEYTALRSSTYTNDWEKYPSDEHTLGKWFGSTIGGGATNNPKTSLFLPHGSYIETKESGIPHINIYNAAYYWSGNVYSPNSAHAFSFLANGIDHWGENRVRSYGKLVRCVKSPLK